MTITLNQDLLACLFDGAGAHRLWPDVPLHLTTAPDHPNLLT